MDLDLTTLSERVSKFMVTTAMVLLALCGIVISTSGIAALRLVFMGNA